MNSVRDFYDDLADDYELIYADWNQAVVRQGAVLARIIRAELLVRTCTLLDCTCGVGTQSIGLAIEGFDVTGTDLSPRAIVRARALATSFQVEVDFTVADVRELSQKVNTTFDVVISCDNALPHLTDIDELSQALGEASSCLKPGGLFLASIRDYDEVVEGQRRATQPRVLEGPEGRRIVLQLWDWEPDRPVYALTHLICRERNGSWELRQRQTTYRAIRREELTALLRERGFVGISWLMPDVTGFIQPIVIARKLADTY